ncbi:Membrane spanning protein [Lachnospiraceae bacterium TWA4]|nr:Membrane spanning protein [Lachnospiraceae bacterium TWA4]
MDENIIIGRVLDIGERMLQSGGEVSRVEDTIGRILKAYQFVRVDVFTITSEIQLTAVYKDGTVYNQIRRINKWGTNLEELERLNQLSRDLCEDKIQLKDIHLARKDTAESKNKIFVSYIGAILAASGFTIFFGGGLADALATAVLACVITVMNRHSHWKSENQLLYYFLFSIITGFIGNLLVFIGSSAGIVMDLDKILIGCIMLTIPGIAITYSVRDMLLGEIITGLLRFFESLLIATSIAGGYILSSMIMGGGL